MVKVKALHKVQKQITKKRGHKSNSLHENSRDSQRLRTAGAREDKLAKLLVAATKANRTYVERIAYFQSALQDLSETVSDEVMQEMTASYIARDEEELETLKVQRRPGRPPSTQEDRLKGRIDSEEGEYRSGFWVPDVRDEDGRKRLERWNGDWSALNTLKFVRVVSAGGIKLSSFPPRGLS